MNPRLDSTAAAPAQAMAVPAAAVREQLDRMLASAVFKNSKRYSSLLRYVVEHALNGTSGQMKERTLGVEVFGRAPDYDTNIDPVVRIAASEIRRRIAQYYYQAGRESEIRIDLPTGSYAPTFHFAAENGVAPAALPLPVAARLSRSTWRGIALATVVLAAAVAVGWLGPWRGRSGLDRFWEPLVKSRGQVLICVGGGGSTTGSQPAGARGAQPAPARNSIAFRDATMLARVAGLIESRGASFNIRSAADSSFTDLREGPVVLIGGFNNDWTLRLTAATRFGFERFPDRLSIVDRRAQQRKEWSVQYDSEGTFSAINEDYALISRLWDPSTESIVVIGAGLTSYGTIAASEFLTNPNYMESLTRQAPDNWESKSLQAVIATRVLNGSSGPPRVAAAHFW
jgi:hypothetical protein